MCLKLLYCSYYNGNCLFSVLMMQRDLLILFKAFHARSISSNLILTVDPSLDQPVQKTWLSFETFWQEPSVVFLRYSRGDDQTAACGQLGKPGAIQTPSLRVPEQFQMAVNA